MSSQELRNACRPGNWDEAKALIAANPLLLCETSEGRRVSTPAYLATIHNKPDMLEYMYDALLGLPGPHDQMLRDAFEKEGTWDGSSPVHIAAKKGYIKCLEILIKICPSGAAILEHGDYMGNTSAHCAVHNNQKDSLEFILRNAPRGLLILELRNKIYKPLDLASGLMWMHFTPQKIRKIGMEKEWKQFSTIDAGPFASLVFSIIQQHSEV